MKGEKQRKNRHSRANGNPGLWFGVKPYALCAMLFALCSNTDTEKVSSLYFRVINATVAPISISFKY